MRIPGWWARAPTASGCYLYAPYPAGRRGRVSRDSAVAYDDEVITLQTGKVPETVKFPGLFGRADRI